MHKTPKFPILFVLSGLPGTGKTTLGQKIAAHFNAAYLRIDTIEQAFKRLTETEAVSEGYDIAHVLAEDNLRVGNNVVADCVNPVSITRTAWRNIAKRSHAELMEIEIICSDSEEHRRRVENRKADIPGHRMPTWQEVIGREYYSWDNEVIIIDTAGKTPEESFEKLLKAFRV